MGNRMGLMLPGFNILDHHGFQFVGVFRTHGDQAQGVTQKTDAVVVLQKGGIVGEDRTFLGIFDMHFQGQGALALRQLEQRELEA